MAGFMVGLFACALFVVGTAFAQKTPVSSQVMTLDTLLQQIERAQIDAREYSRLASAEYRQTSSVRSFGNPEFIVGMLRVPYNHYTNVLNILEVGINERVHITPYRKKKEEFARKIDALSQDVQVEFLHDLKARVRSLYYQWYIAGQKVSCLRRYLHRLEKIRRYHTDHQKYDDFASRNRANVCLARLNNDITEQEGLIDALRYEINTLRKVDLNTRFDIDTSVRLPFYNAEVLDSVNFGLYRKDIKLLDEQTELLREALLLPNDVSYPDMLFSVRHLFPLSVSVRPFYLLHVRLGVQIPLFKNKKQSPSYRQTIYTRIRANAEKRDEQLRKSQCNLYVWETKMDALKSTLYTLKQKVIPELEKVFRHNTKLYHEDNADLYVLLQGWEELKNAELDMWNTLSSLLLYGVAYQRELYL